MALYDGLPLGTPTKIFDDGVALEVWATRTANGGTVENRLKGAALIAQTSQATITAGIANALARLRQIQVQATALHALPDYGVANLVNLNDLLHKVQQVGDAVGDLATDVLFIARQLSGQFDGTT